MTHNRQEIVVGSRLMAGTIEVDSSRVTGEGGPTRPQLVVPALVRMRQHQPDEGQIALVALQAWLTADQQGFPSAPLASVCDQRLDDNMPYVSQRFEQTQGAHLDLRFRLTMMEIADLESRRHSGSPASNLQLYIGLKPQIVGLRSIGEGDERPWGESGLASFRAHFWNVTARHLSLEISQQTWVENVLPGLGHDRVRLTELKFPPPLPDQVNAVEEFDKARRRVRRTSL